MKDLAVDTGDEKMAGEVLEKVSEDALAEKRWWPGSRTTAPRPAAPRSA